MSRLSFLFFCILFFIDIKTFDIPNFASTYINPNIFNSSNPSDRNCYYEINIWYYVPLDINKVYFSIQPDENYSNINLYYGNPNELLGMKLIENNIDNIYEISREKDNIYVTFIKEQNENKKILIKHFYSDNNNDFNNIESKILQLSYYIKFPVELINSPTSQACLSFYDYEKDPDKIYLISNNNYYIFYINSNSSSINYNTKNLQYFDLFSNINSDYHIYKNGNYYYLISKMIFIKIEKKENLLILEDISSNNEKFKESKIKNNANVYNLEQIEYLNGELMHLYFIYNEEEVCSVEFGCYKPNISGRMNYISFYYNGECFFVNNGKELFKCSFIVNSESNMELLIGNKINNRFFDNEEHMIIQIKIFPLDDINNNFLLCSRTNSKSLFCIIFNYNSVENDLNTKDFIELFNNIDDIKSVNIFPYKSNKLTNDNLVVAVNKNEYSILDINNNISITGIQTFKLNEYINQDTSFYDLGNNKFFLTYSTGANNIQSNIGIYMGTIPKSKKILKIIEEYQEYLEISFQELFDENEKLSNENYKVIFINKIYDSKDNNFNSDDIKFFYNDNLINLNFKDYINPEYEIKNKDDNENQKIIIKLSNSTFNIFLNYTIIGEQLASKNVIKIMNQPKCNKYCFTCEN